jgi:class 3 adenylate cyclase
VLPRTGPGEIELVGDDIAGIGVHIAARIAAAAEASSVWVSRIVTDLVTGSGLRFVNRGSHSLKGVPGTWDLYAVGDDPLGRE